MSEQLLYTPMRALDANGEPVPNARAYFYTSQTTDLIVGYSNTSLTSPHPSPLLADGNGVFAPVYFAAGTLVKVIVQDADGVELPGFPLDPAQNFPTGSETAASIGYAATDNNSASNVQQAITNASDAAAAAQQDIDDLGTLAQRDEEDLAREQSTWNAGESTSESTISPAKLDARLSVYASPWGFVPSATYQDVTASRAADTSYRNETGSWIFVYIEASGNRTFSVSTDDVTFIDLPLVNAFGPLSAPIPPGTYYKLDGTFTQWLEVR